MRCPASTVLRAGIWALFLYARQGLAPGECRCVYPAKNQAGFPDCDIGEPLTPRVRHRRPRPGTAGPRSAGRLQRALDDAARREIRAALRETDGNVASAARALGVTEMGIRK